MLPDDICVTFGNYISTLTTPSDSTQLLVTNYDDPDTQHAIMSDNPFRGRGERGYCSRFHYGKRCYKGLRFYCYMCSIKKRVHYWHGPVRMGS